METLFLYCNKINSFIEENMKKNVLNIGWLVVAFLGLPSHLPAQELFPDGSVIPEWFYDDSLRDVSKLGKMYEVTDYGVVKDSTLVQTDKIQAVIDQAAQSGGGVVCIPEGTYLSGSLFFKPGTHLYLKKGGTLKGSDNISDFAVVDTRMEGQNLKYFAALVNAAGVDGFTLSGEGKINGNGLRYWKEFWLRREVNRHCTNLEALRPRLVFISDSKDVQISGVRLENSPFWTTHLYRCENVKLLGLHIFAPAAPVKAPSSDAIDIDVCTNVLVKNCHISVNDDAVALKGGKGPWADSDKEHNGSNRNIIIEDCVYGFCHSALTCGSESIHNHNVIFRRIQVDKAQRVLWLKMRPDMPQRYEYIKVEDIKGNAGTLLYVKPWTQFFDLKGRKDIPRSYSNHITLRNIHLDCKKVFDVQKAEDQYFLSDFVFENLTIQAAKAPGTLSGLIDGVEMKNVRVNGVEMK